MTTQPVKRAEDFWSACQNMNAYSVGTAQWAAAFKALVQIASELTATGFAARRFLFNQCGITITVESEPTASYQAVGQATPSIAAVANDQ